MKAATIWLCWALVMGLGVSVAMVLAVDMAPEDAEAWAMRDPLERSLGNSITWVTETVGVGETPSLVVDSAGTPHLGYAYPGPCVGYAVLSGTTWLTKEVDCGAIDATLALDNTGNPHITYHSFAHGNTVDYAVLSDTVWLKQMVRSAGGPSQPSVEVDSSGTPHIAHGYAGPCVGHAVLSGTTWLTKEVDCGAANATLALDETGNPHIAYHSFSHGNSIDYAVLSGTVWLKDTAFVVGGERGSYPSLAVDGSGTPHIAYTHPGPWVGYATVSGGTWVTEPVDREMVAGPSLALDRSGKPHIAYCDVRPVPPQGPGDGVKYAKWTESGWAVAIVDGVKCGSVSLALDAFDRPRVAYYDEGTGTLKYAYVLLHRVYLPLTQKGY